MTHNDFNQVSIAFCSNMVASNIERSQRQISLIETQSLNDKKLAKKIEKLNKIMNEASLLASEIYNQVLTY
jgi:tetrahydromethanopterin S-methyltransferase subunit A